MIFAIMPKYHEPAWVISKIGRIRVAVSESMNMSSAFSLNFTVSNQVVKNQRGQVQNKEFLFIKMCSHLIIIIQYVTLNFPRSLV